SIVCFSFALIASSAAFTDESRTKSPGAATDAVCAELKPDTTVATLAAAHATVPSTAATTNRFTRTSVRNVAEMVAHNPNPCIQMSLTASVAPFCAGEEIKNVYLFWHDCNSPLVSGGHCEKCDPSGPRSSGDCVCVRHRAGRRTDGPDVRRA